MQISGNSYSTLPAPVNRRGELADRRHGDRRQSSAAEVVGQAAQQSSERSEITRIRTRASVETQKTDAEPRKFSDLLTVRNGAAVQAYRSNGPSLVERYGVELVGVDVYA